MYSTTQGSGLLHHTRITLFIVFSPASSGSHRAGSPRPRVRTGCAKTRRESQLRQMEPAEMRLLDINESVDPPDHFIF